MNATIDTLFKMSRWQQLLMLLAVMLALPLVFVLCNHSTVPAAATTTNVPQHDVDRVGMTESVNRSAATTFSFNEMSKAELSVIEELHQSGVEITEIDNVPLRIYGLRAQLDDRQITEEVLANLKRLPNLKSLRLAKSRINDTRIGDLAELSSLEELDLAETAVGDGDLQRLSRLVQLKSLNLHGTQVTATGLTHLRGLKRLLSLDLSFTRINSLQHLHTPNRMTAINLTATRITDDGLKPLVRMPELQMLTLRHTRITNAAGETIGRLERLESLDLSRTQITNLRFLHDLSELRELHLTGTRIPENELSCLVELPLLNRLLLQGTEVTDMGLRHLSQLPNLQTLFVSGRGITDAGLKHLHRLTKLQRLVLSGTNATSHGVEALKQTLPETQIAGPSSTSSETNSDQTHQELDVVYARTPPEFVKKMLQLADIQPGDMVYDLGCGDGRFVIAAAEMYGVQAIGFDIDPERVRESRENVRRHHVEHLVTIEQADIFKLDLSNADVVTLYLLPELNVRLIPQFAQLKPGSRIVSYEFDMRGARAIRTVRFTPRVPGWREHSIHLWTTPWCSE